MRAQLLITSTCFYQWLGQRLWLRNEVVSDCFINNINLPTLSFTVPIVLPLHAAWYSFPYLAIRFLEICNKKRGYIAILVSNAANPCVKQLKLLILNNIV